MIGPWGCRLQFNSEFFDHGSIFSYAAHRGRDEVLLCLGVNFMGLAQERTHSRHVDSDPKFTFLVSQHLALPLLVLNCMADVTYVSMQTLRGLLSNLPLVLAYMTQYALPKDLRAQVFPVVAYPQGSCFLCYWLSSLLWWPLPHLPHQACRTRNLHPRAFSPTHGLGLPTQVPVPIVSLLLVSTHLPKSQKVQTGGGVTLPRNMHSWVLATRSLLVSMS